MLCSICIDILGGSARPAGGTSHPFLYEPHTTSKTLRKSQKAGCTICMALAEVAQRYVDLRKDQPVPVRVYLNKLRLGPREGAKFLLDYEVLNAHKVTFVLKETNRNQQVQPIRSKTTSSDEVFETAKYWMQRCRCAQSWEDPAAEWYPRRLIDLEGVRRCNGKLHHAKVQVIESSELLKPNSRSYAGDIRQRRSRHRYVTLSHCWGKAKPGQEPLKLTSKTQKQLMTDGVELQRMPKTFQDAIYFASRLDGVRYIWIDSLCIRQPLEGPGYDREEQGRDWLEQSRYMDQVYLKAYLNISATASMDGSGGLFRDRNLDRLNEIDVNVRYPPGSREVIRCSVFNLSTWTGLVDEAPINRRGWVVQERILAPRVLHFCHNQIAWECAEYAHAESLPADVLMLKDFGNRLAEQGPTKDLTLNAGLQLRNIRLRELRDPDLGMPDLYVYELWKKVVEAYSQTQLTFSKDKLVALAGIASHFRSHLFSRSSTTAYVAGMWSDHLESQLLWHVNEVYRKDLVVFQSPGQRNQSKAPSFSWAAIDTPFGITYPDVTDYGAGKMATRKRSILDRGSHESGPSEELFFKILDCSITLVDAKNPFGMICGGILLVKPRYLRPIHLYTLPKERRVPFAWRLKDDRQTSRPPEHTNIILDAPSSEDIFQRNTELYCMVGAYGERTVRSDSRYLYCLLLRYEGTVSFGRKYRGFRRVGITKLSYTMDSRGQDLIRGVETDERICLL